jgi:hypothetical protein
MVPADLRDSFSRAVSLIARHGDTDIFPAPIEKYLFFDQPDSVVDVLCAMWADLSAKSKSECKAEIRSQFTSDSLISPAGYTGFRWATQIDQFWNAYLLGLVIEIAEDIERRRVTAGGQHVYSYRFDPTSNESLFRREVGWAQFQEESIRRAKESGCGYVVSCDISDFYPRIYHHTLENELLRCDTNVAVISQIMSILSAWSNSVSYGLPVGGDAARVLAELAIVPIDSIMVAEGVSFCRFVDDYRLFAKSREDAYAAWVSLSQHLLQLNGLQLQKYKTIVEPSGEYAARIEKQLGAAVSSDTEDRKELAFLAIKIHYDPYSDTAGEDYEQLREAISSHDILGMMNRQLSRSRVDQSLTKKMLRATRFLNESQQYSLSISLLQSIESVFPIFPLVMRTIKDVLGVIGADRKAEILQIVRSILEQDSFVVQVPVNRLHALRLLSLDHSPEAGRVLSNAYRQTDSYSIRRDIILINAVRKDTAWLKSIRTKYHSLSPWERTAIAISSFYSGEEGSHWRSANSKNFDQGTAVAEKRSQSPDWVLPL